MDDRPLDGMLSRIRTLTSADDLRYLERWLAHELNPYADLRGVKGGFHHYPVGQQLRAVIDDAETLADEDQATLRLVVDMLYEAYRPKADTARGQVQIKTIKRDYPEIDRKASEEKKTLVYVTDENGEIVYATFYFHYAYIRLYAAKGDADRKAPKLLSIYADRGMGKGGSGGYVAAALADELVTEDEVLNAWHAGKATYGEFLDRCAHLVGQPSERDDQEQAEAEPPAAQVQPEPKTAIPAWKDLSFAEQQLLDLFKTSIKDTRGVLSWKVRSKSFWTDRDALYSLEKKGLIELLSKEGLQRIFHITPAGEQAAG